MSIGQSEMQNVHQLIMDAEYLGEQDIGDAGGEYYEDEQKAHDVRVARLRELRTEAHEARLKIGESDASLCDDIFDRIKEYGSVYVVERPLSEDQLSYMKAKAIVVGAESGFEGVEEVGLPAED